MSTLTYKNQSFEGSESESVLDCLIRNGQKIPHSCHSGICQSCVMKTNTQVDAVAQKGLNSSKKESGLFFTCQQKLNKDFEIFQADESAVAIEAEIISQERITDSVAIISIQMPSDFTYRSGQFINVIREDNLCRSYSLASLSNDRTLKLHVRKVPDGVMSNWLYDSDLKHQKIKISGPIGECYLNQDMMNDDLVLLGVGTGLAPLYGIILDAIAQGFSRKISLFHGGLSCESLYLVEDLKNLEQEHEQFSYHPTFLKGEPRTGFIQGDLLEVLKNLNFETQKTTVMVCGDPEMVKKMKQVIFMKGVPSKKIFSDAFVSKKPVK